MYHRDIIRMFNAKARSNDCIVFGEMIDEIRYDSLYSSEEEMDEDQQESSDNVSQNDSETEFEAEYNEENSNFLNGSVSDYHSDSYRTTESSRRKREDELDDGHKSLRNYYMAQIQESRCVICNRDFTTWIALRKHMFDCNKNQC